MFVVEQVKKRILSAIALAGIFIFSILYKDIFFILCMILASMMIYEWVSINSNNYFHLVLGILVIVTSVFSLLMIYMLENGKLLTITFFIIIWTVDIFALIGGKLIGGSKLAPEISPNKTWSGLISGVLASVIIISILSKFSLFIDVFINIFSSFELFLVTFITAIFAQISDLFESYFKRINNLKDSGSIIPGHGGILDRFDSILFSAPIFFVIIKLTLYLPRY